MAHIYPKTYLQSSIYFLNYVLQDQTANTSFILSLENNSILFMKHHLILVWTKLLTSPGVREPREQKDFLKFQAIVQALTNYNTQDDLNCSKYIQAAYLCTTINLKNHFQILKQFMKFLHRPISEIKDKVDHF